MKAQDSTLKCTESLENTAIWVRKLNELESNLELQNIPGYVVNVLGQKALCRRSRKRNWRESYCYRSIMKTRYTNYGQNLRRKMHSVQAASLKIRTTQYLLLQCRSPSKWEKKMIEGRRGEKDCKIAFISIVPSTTETTSLLDFQSKNDIIYNTQHEMQGWKYRETVHIILGRAMSPIYSARDWLMATAITILLPPTFDYWNTCSLQTLLA